MKYRVLLSGCNVLVGRPLRQEHGLGGDVVLGFATTRIVTAADRDEACKAAIESALAELRDLMANEASNPPKFVVEEIEELSDADDRRPPKGFTFFKEK